jgi:diadenosine tetraphosphate (Ap4A) HIT family hydrolase
MTESERVDAHRLLRIVRTKLAADDSSIEGFNVGMNCGEVAGQTVFHAHIHLMPRRRGDTPQPRGGVRGAIPAKMSYTTGTLR